jgi:hypothetical protein
VRRHARELDHPPQLQFAPPAAGLRPPQRADQRPGLLPELLRALPGELHLLREFGMGLRPRDVRRAKLRLHAGEGLPHRPDELLDVEALGELSLGECRLLRRGPLQDRRPFLSRAGPFCRGGGDGAEAVAGEQVAERDADRDPGKQGEDGHAFSIRQGSDNPLVDTREVRRE